MELPYPYLYFVRHIIPGPQSLSYLVPHILLPIALLTPRSILSRWQNIAIFVPVMVGCTIHAWTVMGSVDVPSLNGLFWTAFLLVLHDPWTKFALLKPDIEINGDTYQGPAWDGNYEGRYPFEVTDSNTINWGGPLGGFEGDGMEVVSTVLKRDGTDIAFDVMIAMPSGNYSTVSCSPE